MNIARTSSPENTEKDEKDRLKMAGSPDTKWVDLALTAGTKHYDNCQQKLSSSSDAIVFIALSRVCEYCDKWWKWIYN